MTNYPQCVNLININMGNTFKTDHYGAKRWELPNGHLHRENGPAIEYKDGTKSWWKNNELHREDGPAIEFANGDKFWYLNDIEYTEDEHKSKVRSRRLKKLL